MPPSADPVPAIVDRLRQLIAELDVRLGTEAIDEATFLFEGGLGLDSFAVVEMIVLIEREFAFEFPESDLTPESFHDLRTLAQVIARNARPA